MKKILLVVLRMASFFIEQDSFIVLAAIEDSYDIDPFLVHMKGDDDALSVAGNAQARTSVIASVSTVGEGGKAFAV